MSISHTITRPWLEALTEMDELLERVGRAGEPPDSGATP
jgi:hypothetical protein